MIRLLAPVGVAGPHPTIVPLFVVLGLAGVTVLALVVLLIRDRGPGPVDVALGYEQAWDNLDFAALWTLSAPELRDGRTRDEFVRDKDAAYRAGTHLRHLASDFTAVAVAPDPVDPDHAIVTTAVDLRDGTRIHDTVRLARRDGVWLVTEYRLAPSTREA
jgi:hypothetical protein